MRLPAVLLHPGFGVVLVEFEPNDTPDAAGRFRRELVIAGLWAADRDDVPVVRIRLAPAQSGRLGRALPTG